MPVGYTSEYVEMRGLRRDRHYTRIIRYDTIRTNATEYWLARKANRRDGQIIHRGQCRDWKRKNLSEIDK